MSFRPYPWSTLFSVTGLAILLSLGTWQLQRLEWKNTLIKQTEARLQTLPVPLRDVIGEHKQAPGDKKFLRVTFAGQIDTSREIYLFKPSEGKPGYRVLSPVAVKGGGEILLARGFVPLESKRDAADPHRASQSFETITGYILEYENKAPFVPENDFDHNEWYYLSLEQVADWLQSEDLVPFYVVREGEPPSSRFAEIKPEVNLPNNHLSYAITWYGLGLALVGVYFAYHWSEERLSFDLRSKNKDS